MVDTIIVFPRDPVPLYCKFLFGLKQPQDLCFLPLTPLTRGEQAEVCETMEGAPDLPDLDQPWVVDNMFHCDFMHYLYSNDLPAIRGDNIFVLPLATFLEGDLVVSHADLLPLR
eukprot:7313568-Lingulodinium_polyedra.AAC.1